MKTGTSVFDPVLKREYYFKRCFQSMGFTLLELLVVMTIIIILVALLLSAIFHAKQKAHQIVCAGKLRQWGMATFYYTMDNEDYLPLDGSPNGTSIYANEWQDASDEISSTNQYYKQYLHGLTEEEVTESNLHDSYNTRYLRQTTEPNESAAGEVVDNVEGLYDIEIQYRFGNESAARTVSFKFYLITQYTYEQINQAPTFNYTEKISFTTDDAVVDENGYAKRHYFKYTNLYTSTTTGGTFSNPVLMTYTEALLPETLHYPTLTYNPEKYRIQYTKTLYNTQQTVQINFTTAVGANNQEYGVVTTNTYQTNQLIDTKTERIEKVDNQYLYTIQFKDVGEYNFSKTCILRTGVGSYVEANSIFLSDKPLSFIVRLKSATDNVCISIIASNFTRTNIAPVYAKKKHKDKVLHFFENKLNLCLNMAHQPV